MLQPSDIDRVTDQYPKLLQCIECRTWAIRIGLKNASDDSLAREPGDCAMTVFDPERLKTANVARLARVTEANVFGALHVGSNKRRDSARRSRHKPISDRYKLAEQRGLVRHHKFFARGIIRQTRARSFATAKR
ncbi:hypothetical protein [Bradyrhizobium pachyrhizi]|uniref:hypothetical protein n=1 Tax=Bradyrhizobium pachyrhizi TaxID=280333 RepID=UPI00067DA31B|nr:hypothetical protein [Bradyrhizobium pachyrhizi]